jgi:tellurium resistance protein TerZ
MWVKKTTASPDLTLTSVAQLRVGMAWSASGSGTKGIIGKLKKKKGVDLDLVCVASQGLDAKRLCWFDYLDAFENGGLLHLGDNTTGKGDGDDEEILAEFGKIPNTIDRLTFFGMAYKPGVTFNNVAGATLSVYNHQTGEALNSYMPTLGTNKNAVAIIEARRIAPAQPWQIIEIDDMVNIAVSGNLGNDQANIIRAAAKYGRRA